MKGLETILIIGGIALAGWCFFMGPCKDWLPKNLAIGPPSPTTGTVGGVRKTGDELAAAQVRMMKARDATLPASNFAAGWY